LEQAESLIKRHEALLTTMDANDEKINGVIQFASTLCREGHMQGKKSIYFFNEYLPNLPT